MTKKEVGKAVAVRLGTRDWEGKIIVETVLDVLTEAMTSNDRVTLRGWGTFKRRLRVGRSYPNLQNLGKSVYRPANTTVTFKPGAIIRGLLKERDEKGKDR